MSNARTVSDLSQQCLDNFSRAMSSKMDIEHQDRLSTRLDSFKLWADGAGAQAEPLLSLDSRLQSRPDDLSLVKYLLNTLSKFIQYFMDISEKGNPITKALEDIDSVIKSLKNWSRITARLDSLEKSAKDISVSSFDKVDHLSPEENDNNSTKNYFANNAYFEDKESTNCTEHPAIQERSSTIWNGVSALDVSNDCRLLASGDFCGTVHIWDLEQGVKTKEFIAGNGYIYDVKISPDSCFAAAVCDDGYAYMWSLKTGDSDAKFHHGKRVRSVALSSDSKFLVTGGDSGFKVWDRDTGACIPYSEASGSALTALSMTPDDRWIVTASNRGSIRFWDRTTGKSHCIVDAHKQTIYSMAFRPRGDYFATVSRDQTVRIWSYGLLK